MKSIMYAAAITLAAALSTSATAQMATVKLTKGYNLASFGNNGRNSIVVAYGIRDMGGTIALCGSYYLETPNASESVPRQMLRSMKFKAGGKRLRINASHFNRIHEIATGETANCKPAGRDWVQGLKTGDVDLTSRSVGYWD